MNTLKEYGLAVPSLLLPANGTDLSAWAVIACDQYTQDKEYWERAARLAEGKPSALNLILPEVYLDAEDKQERIQKIHAAMRSYLAEGVFAPARECLMYVERSTSYGRKRKGLVVCIDLEAYDWKPESHALIRATEQTITSRLPPRMEIRRGAALELPHIMLLVNDPERSLVEEAGKTARGREPLYDTDLMLNGGHITGWGISDEAEIAAINSAIAKLAAANTDAQGKPFLFAVGDGNHSLAAAKAVWNEYRDARIADGCSEEEVSCSPVRYALAEIVNIYDEALTFEPIHRVIFSADPAALIQAVREKLGGTVRKVCSRQEAEEAVGASRSSFAFVYTGRDGEIHYTILDSAVTELAVSRLQPVLDEFVQDGDLDYIHGSDEVFRLGEKKQTIGLLLPPIVKDNFFSTIAAAGCLPRKSFSMGEADEKRFYLEARRLFS